MTLFKLICALFILTACFVEPAVANKFTTIGGGVSGADREKILILKQISAIAGNFLILLAIIALLTRGRFEGFIGMYKGKKGESVTRVPLVMIIIGSLLIGIYFL